MHSQYGLAKPQGSICFVLDSRVQLAAEGFVDLLQTINHVVLCDGLLTESVHH